MNRCPYVSRMRFRFWFELAAVSGFFAVIPAARAQIPVLTNPPEVNNAMVGQQIIFQITATNHPTSYSAIQPTPSPSPSPMPLILGFPPNEVASHPLGLITGIPTADGSTAVDLFATNEIGTGMGSVTFSIEPTPSPSPVPLIISSTCAAGRTGTPFSFQVLTTNPNGSPDLSVTVTGLPPELHFDVATNVIFGTPAADGSSVVMLSVSDGSTTTNNFLQLTFISELSAPMITGKDRALLVPGQLFEYTITADTDATFFGYIGLDGNVNGELPSGLSFDEATHTISGTPAPVTRIYAGGMANIDSSAVPRADATPSATGTPVTIKKEPPKIQLLVCNCSPLADLPGTFEFGPLVKSRIFGTGTAPLNFVTGGNTRNISTRGYVQIGENVLIGGFIITGASPKKVILRAIGPSLTDRGVLDALADPIIELHKSDGTVLTNDNWRDSQEQEITDTGIPPTNDLESAIVATLDPVDPMNEGSGHYTAIVRGEGDNVGVALMEVYDLDDPALSELVNISTRGFVGTAEHVMIGGFIIGEGDGRPVVVRALGPSLAAFGVTDPLMDPSLELRDVSGELIASNDDWKETQQTELETAGLALTDDRESAIIALLTGGLYTAIVRGTDPTDSTGVGLVEVYHLE